MPKNPTTIITVQLKPDAQQAESLDLTAQEFARACNELSKAAYQNKIFGRWQLYRKYYKEIRQQFNLNSALVVTCTFVIANVYSKNRDQLVQQDQYDVLYNTSSLHWNIEGRFVSMWTVNGRIKVPFVCDERRIDTLEAKWLLGTLQKQAGTYILLVECVMQGNLIHIDLGTQEILLAVPSSKILVQAEGLAKFLKSGCRISLLDEDGKKQFIAMVEEEKQEPDKK